MVELLRPHDLLWGFNVKHLPADAPAWCEAALCEAPPVVVRRAPPRRGWVAVGLRGSGRAERCPAWLPVSAVSALLSPEHLCQRLPDSGMHLPVWQALLKLRPLLNASGLRWGVTGSAGFELASGIPATHAGSDLDLLLRAPEPLAPAAARQLLAALGDTPCRVDIQMQTPLGGVALAEWARAPARVMVKGEQGPQLVADPWEVVPA
ncbi:MAG: malonate decarboxylase holo-ACP synthase [Pseudomonas sp.]|uniref:malonate decarboxylase holo-ACP synthase n=1 Tax=Pseudomonas sp. TaxID=306 RepID=UPI003D0EC88C